MFVPNASQRRTGGRLLSSSLSFCFGNKSRELAVEIRCAMTLVANTGRPDHLVFAPAWTVSRTVCFLQTRTPRHIGSQTSRIPEFVLTFLAFFWVERKARADGGRLFSLKHDGTSSGFPKYTPTTLPKSLLCALMCLSFPSISMCARNVVPERRARRAIFAPEQELDHSSREMANPGERHCWLA